MGEDARKQEQQEAAGGDRGHGEVNASDVALAKTVTSGSVSGNQADSDPAPSPTEERQRNFAPGEVLAGRYEIVRFIAQGGMGEVYEASDRELRSRVALKTVRANRTGKNAVERLKREIHLARQVRHVNVCHLFDVGFHTPAGDGRRTVFLTMELLEGETLAERLKRSGSMPTAEALPLLRQMAAGIDAAHAQGIIHRDFKPDNVFLVPSARSDSGIRVVITDFGVARGADQEVDAFSLETGEGAVIGTPLYMAPEQRVGAAVSPATDLYSFGLVMRELITGQLPGGRRRPERRDVPSAPRTAPILDGEEAIDPNWASVIERLLSINPEQRPPSAGDAVSALQLAVPEGIPAGAKPAGGSVSDPGGRPPSAETGWMARRSRAAALGVFAALAIALVVALRLVLPLGRPGPVPPAATAPPTAASSPPAPAAGRPVTAPAVEVAQPPAVTAPSAGQVKNPIPSSKRHHRRPTAKPHDELTNEKIRLFPK